MSTLDIITSIRGILNNAIRWLCLSLFITYNSYSITFILFHIVLNPSHYRRTFHHFCHSPSPSACWYAILALCFKVSIHGRFCPGEVSELKRCCVSIKTWPGHMVTTVQQNRLIRELKTTHHILSNFKVVNSWQLAMPCYALFLLIPSHCRNIDMNSKWISWPNQILPSESEPTKPKFWHPRGNNVGIFGCIEQKNKQDVAHFDIVWHIDVLACFTRCRNLHDILIYSLGILQMRRNYELCFDFCGKNTGKQREVITQSHIVLVRTVAW